MTFEEYVLARGPGLLRLARLLVDDVDRADDLVQDTLVRVYPRWARILRADQPDLYVRRTLINVNASWWRRRSSREMPAELDVDAWPGADDHGSPTADRLVLWRRVRALPHRQRAVIALRYYEDLDDQYLIRGPRGTIAVVLHSGVYAGGTSPGTYTGSPPTLANGRPYQEFDASAAPEHWTASIRVPDPWVEIHAQGAYGLSDVLLVGGGLQPS